MRARGLRQYRARSTASGSTTRWRRARRSTRSARGREGGDDATAEEGGEPAAPGGFRRGRGRARAGVAAEAADHGRRGAEQARGRAVVAPRDVARAVYVAAGSAPRAGARDAALCAGAPTVVQRVSADVDQLDFGQLAVGQTRVLRRLRNRGRRSGRRPPRASRHRPLCGRERAAGLARDGPARRARALRADGAGRALGPLVLHCARWARRCA